MDDGFVKVTAKDARRQGILEIAREIFMEDGYAAASMSAIAARVGGSKGTLYNYFASKEELFQAVIQDQCDRKLAVLYEGVLTGDRDVAAGLRTIGQRYLDLVLSEESLRFSRMLIAETVRFPEASRVMYEAGPRVTARRLRDYMQAQMDAGRLRSGDPKRAADQFIELCLAGIYRQRLWNAIPHPSARAMQDNVDAALATFMAAYAPDVREATPA
jgi:TetR/AcrR family transcriptional regulator, mexJK operon transcriptional repressor